MYIYVWTYTHMLTYTRMHTYMHMCTYIHIYTLTPTCTHIQQANYGLGVNCHVCFAPARNVYGRLWRLPSFRHRSPHPAAPCLPRGAVRGPPGVSVPHLQPATGPQRPPNKLGWSLGQSFLLPLPILVCWVDIFLGGGRELHFFNVPQNPGRGCLVFAKNDHGRLKRLGIGAESLLRQLWCACFHANSRRSEITSPRRSAPPCLIQKRGVFWFANKECRGYIPKVQFLPG